MKAVFAETLTQHWNPQDSCIHSSISNLFTRHLCLFFLFSQMSLVAERAGRLQCQLHKFLFCSCTLSKFFLSCFSPPWSCHPSLSSFSPPDSLAHVQRGQTPPSSKPSTHTNALTEHTALNSPVWMGLTSHPVAGTTEPARGNLPIDKRVREGQTL